MGALQTVEGALAVVEGLAKFSGKRWEAARKSRSGSSCGGYSPGG
ncbi:hypothetical protein [Streptomyces sp. NPDC058674]